MANIDDLPERFRLGVPEIDVEHVLQAQILDALKEALVAGDRGPAKDLIRDLQDVTEAHFVAEQLLMRLHAYPGFQAHRIEHESLIKDLHTLEEAMVPGGDAAESIRSLEFWLLHHIHTSDKAFGAFMLERHLASGAAPTLSVV